MHLTGRADTSETLRDPDFGVAANAVKLVRTTEMYQWQEYEKSETRDKDGGGKETVTTYSYSQTWSGKVIDSKAFRQSWGHDNPALPPFPSTTFVARTVSLGAFTLSRPLVDEMKEREALRVTQAMAAAPCYARRACVSSETALTAAWTPPPRASVTCACISASFVPRR